MYISETGSTPAQSFYVVTKKPIAIYIIYIKKKTCKEKKKKKKKEKKKENTNAYSIRAWLFSK
jgi:hypothetical protein